MTETLPAEPGYLRHFEACNRFDASHFLAFNIGDAQFGWVRPDLADVLESQIGSFQRSADSLTLNVKYPKYATRSMALADAADLLVEYAGTKLSGEMKPVMQKWGDTPVAQVDIGVMHLFGLKVFGVNLNGWTVKDGKTHMWLAKRAGDLYSHPNKLDVVAAGGISTAVNRMATLADEAKQEANIPESLTKQSDFGGAIDFTCERRGGVRSEVDFSYDLKLPGDFVPKNLDGEVANFQLWPIERVAELVRTTNDIKYNCNMVITSFLVRHGFIDEQHPEFEALRAYLEPHREDRTSPDLPALRR